MRGKIVLAVVLCLAVAAVLGIGAAPARAADGCATCHTTPATGDAPAPHVSYVVSVTDCTVCHVNWTGPPHPAVSRGLRLSLSGRSTKGGYKLNGRLWNSNTIVPALSAHPGVVVYLQQRLWGATAWSDLTQVTTASSPSVPGSYTFTVTSPSPFPAYRAIAQGHVWPTPTGALFKPKRTTLLPTPDLTLEVRGFTPGRPLTPMTVKLGHTLTVSGAVEPADLGGRVTIHVRKHVADTWATRVTVRRAIDSAGTYRWRWTPTGRGEFRVFARITATVAHRSVVTRFPLGRNSIDVY